jgi:hypothetical protein
MSCQYSIGDKVIVHGIEGAVVDIRESHGVYVLTVETAGGNLQVSSNDVLPANK